MFATLLGGLPGPELAGGRAARLVATAIEAQVAAGLEPITDGRLNDPRLERLAAGLLAQSRGSGPQRSVVDAWRFTAGQTSRAVKQSLPGPYSIGRLAQGDRRATTVQVAGALNAIVRELAEAGCPMVEIEETQAHLIGEDAAERELFEEAHQRLTQGTGTHLSLSIVGGSAWGAGLETVLAAPYSSLAVDVIAGPDNWNLVTRLPGDRGVIVGALPAKDSPADATETLLWAARYAAASRGRGLERVGIGSAGSLADLTWEAAVARMNRLGEAARLASMPAGDEQLRQLDPRSVDARTAAMGHGSVRRRKWS